MARAGCAPFVTGEGRKPGGVTLYLGPVCSHDAQQCGKPDQSYPADIPVALTRSFPANNAQPTASLVNDRSKEILRQLQKGIRGKDTVKEPKGTGKGERTPHTPHVYDKHGGNQLPAGRTDPRTLPLTPRAKPHDMQDYTVVNSRTPHQAALMSPLRNVGHSPAPVRARDPTPVSPQPNGTHSVVGGFGRAERPVETSTVKSYTTLNLKRLPSYDWNSAKAPRRPINMATDRFYTNTYGKNRSGDMSPRNKTGQARSDGRMTSSAGATPRIEKKKSPSQEPDVLYFRPSSLGSLSKSGELLTLRGKSETSNQSKNLLARIGDLDRMYEVLEVKPMSGGRVRAPDGHLYARLQESLDVIKSSPRFGSATSSRSKQAAATYRYKRPLKQEQGKYRPLSHTTVKTPTPESPRGHSPLGQYKDFKSAEAYVKYLDTLKDEPRTRSGLVPRGTTAEGRYLDRNNRLLDSVAEYNRPQPLRPRGRSRGDAGWRDATRSRDKVTAEGLMQATLQDLIIEPITLPPGVNPDTFPPLTVEGAQPWGIEDYYHHFAPNDYRPPSANSANSDLDPDRMDAIQIKSFTRHNSKVLVDLPPTVIAE